MSARIPSLPRADLPVTQRQRDVWALIARGACAKEIARETGLAYKTVKVHTYRLFQRIGVSNRTQAALKWHQT